MKSANFYRCSAACTSWRLIRLTHCWALWWIAWQQEFTVSGFFTSRKDGKASGASSPRPSIVTRRTTAKAMRRHHQHAAKNHRRYSSDKWCRSRFIKFLFFFSLRLLMQDGRVEVSDELKDLYSIYQQEIHASTYTSGAPRTQSRLVYDTKLPPIYKRT